MASAPEWTALHGILRSFRVPPDAVLAVHSAISGLSRQGFRAEAMTEALLEYVKGGTLLMPTMTWRTVTPDSPVFDELGTPSHTGVLTEIFRTRYATARSLHPTHSVAGVGPLVKTLLSTHHLGSTPVSAASPYGLMREYPAYILMLGVGLESCTAIHHPEEIIAPGIYLKPESEAETYELVDRAGRKTLFRLRRHRFADRRDFPKYQSLLAAKDQLVSGDIGGVRWTIVLASDLLREVFARLIDQPDFNLVSSG